MTEAKGDGGGGLCVRGRSSQRGNAMYGGRVRFEYKLGMDQVSCCTTSGVAGIRQRNVLVEETNMTLLDKRLDDVTSKLVLYRNLGFNKSGEYKKTFIGSSVGTGSVQVLQGVEFKVEPQEDHAFEVEPHGNVDQVTGSQEVQTQDLINYHSARDREQYSASKWKVGLNKDMDARSNVYVLSNGCKESSGDNND
nr:zinc finger, CCHC-type [Tanacetum cinerariifolium]